MKTEREQIEEMAMKKCGVPFVDKSIKHCDRCPVLTTCQRIDYAEEFYMLGYRKASDVIDEFAKRIKERALHSCREIINCYEVTRIETVIDDIAAEMRKEFESGV